MQINIIFHDFFWKDCETIYICEMANIFHLLMLIIKTKILTQTKKSQLGEQKRKQKHN